MLLKKKKLTAGQDIRFIGKGFPGFVKGQRYMVFLSYQNNLEILAKYNNTEVTVFEYLTETIN
ncbi:MAG: hypothetical protein H7Y13_06180 [Sphingobacteriaceae bacterium]|nr:hypothetical protein [Sphingobacteriaceae bacterium]